MKHERRAALITSTDVGDHPHGGFVARVLRYGPPADDYGTTWAPGVANAGLAQRLPVLAWAHEWTDPIGRATRWWEEADGLYMEFYFDDPEAVPRSRQARAQLMSGTITDVSIGFVREADEKNEDGTTNVTRAGIDEVSLVLRGAVSGAQSLGVRSSAVVSAELVARLSAELVAGQIEVDEFLTRVREAATVLPEPTSQLPAPVDPLAPTMSDEDVAALDAEIDQALESIGRSAPRR